MYRVLLLLLVIFFSDVSCGPQARRTTPRISTTTTTEPEKEVVEYRRKQDILDPHSLEDGSWVTYQTVGNMFISFFSLASIVVVFGCIALFMIRNHYKTKAEMDLEAIEEEYNRINRPDPSPFAIHRASVQPIENQQKMTWDANAFAAVLDKAAAVSPRPGRDKAFVNDNIKIDVNRDGTA